MVNRPFWLDLAKRQWARCSLVWLRGARRAGQTLEFVGLKEAVALVVGEK